MDPFVAEIRIFGFNFAPRGWAFCQGQILPISQNTALFSLLGTTYGGNGQSTFAIPNLQARAPMHPDSGPGLSPRVLGETGGVESVRLLDAEVPLHTHTLSTFNDVGESSVPDASQSLARSTGGNLYGAPASLAAMSPQALSTVGASQPHNNMQPYLAVNFCIALQGVFPQRS
jgi:microcystin-dependent protein